MFLANALRLKTNVNPFSLGDITGLKAWYKIKTGITTSSGNVTNWSDSSGNTSEDMELVNGGTTVPYNSTTGALDFNTSDKGILGTSSDQLNLGAFTIFGVVDIVESGAANEAVLGRAGND